MARFLNNIGALYKEQGDHDKALEYYNKSLSSRVNTFGEHHPSVAAVRKNIASLDVGGTKV